MTELAIYDMDRTVTRRATYTPFLLTPLRGPWGWTWFGIIWGLCGAGAVFQLFFGERYRLSSALAYLFVGWVILVALPVGIGLALAAALAATPAAAASASPA